jgi:hypothetical protein
MKVFIFSNRSTMSSDTSEGGRTQNKEKELANDALSHFK